ncbi:kinase-like domain-containing protein [Lipomyces kononenkoae]
MSGFARTRSRMVSHTLLLMSCLHNSSGLPRHISHNAYPDIRFWSTSKPMVLSSATPLKLADRFELLELLGDGSFGTVTRARVRGSSTLSKFAFSSSSSVANQLKPNAMVAIKSMKKIFTNPAQYLLLREVLFLRAVPPHDSLVRAHEIFLDLSTRQLHIVMECLHMNLHEFLRYSNEVVRLNTTVARSILIQILAGLRHIHSHGYFHRDMKPENVLVSVDPSSLIPIVKLSDFGLARNIYSIAPYTTYVSTRWYRAPEILLKTSQYGPEVDIWALGAIAVEIITLRPLFPGDNEWDQVCKLCKVMGTPDTAAAQGGVWDAAAAYAKQLGFLMPSGQRGVDIYSIMTANIASPITPEDEISLGALARFATTCLQWNANNRPTAADSLQQIYFTSDRPSLRCQM